jgi:MFS family permease
MRMEGLEYHALTHWYAGLLYAMMAVISLVGILPAAFVADKLGRKWTIVPSCIGLASALLLMALTGVLPACVPANTILSCGISAAWALILCLTLQKILVMAGGGVV